MDTNFIQGCMCDTCKSVWCDGGKEFMDDIFVLMLYVRHLSKGGECCQGCCSIYVATC